MVSPAKKQLFIPAPSFASFKNSADKSAQIAGIANGEGRF